MQIFVFLCIRVTILIAEYSQNTRKDEFVSQKSNINYQE